MTSLDQAAGIVYRLDAKTGTVRVLMVTSSRNVNRWLFPKGDIDPGESSADAAKREVVEEAGVYVQVEANLGPLEYIDGRYSIHLDFFLCSYLGEGHRLERRLRRWVNLEEAQNLHHLGKRIKPIIRLAKRRIAQRLD